MTLVLVDQALSTRIAAEEENKVILQLEEYLNQVSLLNKKIEELQVSL